jgi:DNA sulfur modification protein DndB
MTKEPTLASEGLAPLIEEMNARRTAYRRRRDENDYVKVHPADEQKYAEDGWTSHKTTQTHLWLKRKKSFDRLLEDQVWCLFYKMGYPVLNGPRFRIQYKRNDGSLGTKQIDGLESLERNIVGMGCVMQAIRRTKSGR